MKNDTQQSPSYSIKRNEDCIHVDATLNSPSFSAPEEFNDAKIGLKVINEKPYYTYSGTRKHQLFKE